MNAALSRRNIACLSAAASQRTSDRLPDFDAHEPLSLTSAAWFHRHRLHPISSRKLLALAVAQFL